MLHIYTNYTNIFSKALQIWYCRTCLICLLIQWLKNWHAVIWKQTSLLCLSHTRTRGRTETLLLCECGQSVNGRSVTDTHHTTHCSDMQLTNTTILTLFSLLNTHTGHNKKMQRRIIVHLVLTETAAAACGKKLLQGFLWKQRSP